MENWNNQNDTALVYTDEDDGGTIGCNITDQGFEDCVEITRDTGYIPLLVVILFGILSQFIILPLLIVCRRRYKRKKTSQEQQNCIQIIIQGEEEKSSSVAVVATAAAVASAAAATVNDDEEENVPRGVEMAYIEDTTIFDADLMHRRHRHPTTKYRIAEEARMSTIRREVEGEEEEEEERYCPRHSCSRCACVVHDSRNKSQSQRYCNHNYACSHDAADNKESPDVMHVIIPPDENRTRFQSFHDFVHLFRYDNETKRILRLSIPFTISELLQAISEVVVLGIVSYQLGTEALSAFAVFETLIEITTEFAGGVVDAQSSLTGHAYGAKNNVLAGQYVQLCSMVYILFQLPFILFWSFATYDIMLWMDFSPAVAEMAQDYGRLVVWRDVIVGVSESLYDIFEVAEKEIAVAIIGNIEALVELAAIAIALIYFNGDLVTVGAIGIVNAVLFYLFTIVFTFWKGWMKPFAKGMFGSLALKNRLVVKQVFKTATPLAFGSVLMHGEWEVLTVFAAYLGPAEITAWAILGSLWDIFESSSEGIGDAAEIRVAYNLGKRRPDQARISAYKSNVIGIMFSIVISVIFVALGDQIPRWLTSDLTLQRMVGENIPLICIGNIIMTAGSVCWAEIGAQGRYKLATIIFFVSSWFVSIPLAAISVYGLMLDLRGMTASVCIGFLCASTALTYVLLQSDWERLAQKVADINAVAAIGQISKLVLDQHEDDDWKELPIWVREAASVLGYTKTLWDNDKEPSTCNKDWNGLSIPEQEAATSLGYNADVWNDDSDGSSSSSSSS